MSHAIRWILGIFVVTILGSAWLLIGAGASRKRPTGQPAAIPVPATVAIVERRDVPIWRSGIGTVVSLNAITITPQVDGRLLRLTCEEGQEVRSGAVLAQIDPRFFEAQVRQARANQARDQAQLDNARKDITHDQALFAQGIVTQQTIDTMEATVSGLSAAVQSDQAASDLAQIQLDYTTLTAPCDGRIGLRLIDPGSIVHAGTGIVTVTQMSPIAVIFTLSQDHLTSVRAAMGGRKPTVIAYARDESTPLASGTLDSIDSQIDSATGQMRLKAMFANGDHALWPGALVSARLLVRTEHDVLAIPSDSIQRSQNGPLVFVAGSDDTVSLHSVSTGEATDGMTIITAGLDVGDRVVVRGQYRLEAGTHIVAHLQAAASAP